ncbi:MAG TPA: phosphoribosyltransferase family protein [Nitrososphaeraceae archaeon]|nr:phosphoribosyltransferase family protein [Nitrososphaeraceae archaeon]
MKFKKEVSEKSSYKEYCSWEEVESLTKIVADKIRNSNKKYNVILGITNGGIIPARLMARELDIDYILFIPVRNKKLNKEEMPLLLQDKKYLIIDEIYDTGDTFYKVYDAVRIFDCDFAFLMSRYEHNSRGTYVGKVLNHNKWIVFPWEQKTVF